MELDEQPLLEDRSKSIYWKIHFQFMNHQVAGRILLQIGVFIIAFLFVLAVMVFPGTIIVTLCLWAMLVVYWIRREIRKHRKT